MASRKIDTAHVVKLSDNNYERWRLQITLVLKAAKVWQVASGDEVRTVANKEEWDEKDIEAQALIVPTLDEIQTNHVYACDSAHEMLSKLKDVHADSSELNKQRTLAAFLNYTVKQGKKLTLVYAEIEALARNLAELGVKMDEAAVVTKIVTVLPDDKHRSFKKAWDSVQSKDQTMGNLLAD